VVLDLVAVLALDVTVTAKSCSFTSSSKGFPHSPSQLHDVVVRQNGNNPKVVQDLLRHASYQITANY